MEKRHRGKKYDKPLELKENVEFDDLIKTALKPYDHEKKNQVKRKQSVSRKK